MLYARHHNCIANISFFTMETKNISYNVEKGYRAPKELNKENTSFVIFCPETVTIKPSEQTYIHLKFSVEIPNELLTTYVETSKLKEKCIKIIGQVNEQNRRVRLEYFNKGNKDFVIKKNEPIAIFTIINTGSMSAFFKKKVFTVNQSINQ